MFNNIYIYISRSLNSAICHVAEQSILDWLKNVLLNTDNDFTW